MKDLKPSDIVPLLQSGDVTAFETIYRLYANNLYIFACSYISDKIVSEDIVQEVFARLWDRRKELNIKSNIHGYLFSMVKNKCLDYLRKPRKTISLDDEEVDQRRIHYIALQDEATSRLIESELEKSIHEAIELLPEACRAVFMKTRIEGMKYKEAARELNISVKTVESHMTKALKHLRVHLKEFLSVLL